VDNSIFDNLFKANSYSTAEAPIVIVAIDEKSLNQLGRWQSWPRQYYAEVLQKLSSYQARVVAFDIVFDAQDKIQSLKTLEQLEEYLKQSNKNNFEFKKILDYVKKSKNELSSDWMLEQAIADFQKQSSKTVVLGYFVAQQTKKKTTSQLPSELKKILRSTIPFRPRGELIEDISYEASEFGINYPQLLKQTHHHGYFSMAPDFDGVVRHYALIRGHYGYLFPSLALKVYETYLGVPAIVDWLGKSVGIISFAGTKKIFPIATDGLMRINYYGEQNSFKTVSLSDVINSEQNIEVNYKGKVAIDSKAQLFNEKVVLIGATATGIYDVRNTPVQSNLPGVEIHANVINQLMNNHIYDELNDVLLIKYLLLVGVFLFLLTLLLVHKSFIWSVSFMLLYYLANYYLYAWIFQHRIVLYVFPSLFVFTFYFVALNIYRYFLAEQENSFIKKTFQSYVSPEVAKAMLENPEKIKLGGEFKVLSILFSDVESFTTFAENMPPEILTKTLNDYLGFMTEQVFLAQGTLDKYIGDAVMAFWGAPLDDQQHAKHATTCALHMIQKQQIFKTRIGINTGRVSVGNMGSANQFAYTVIGDAVNLASRLENLNKYYHTQILITDDTYQLIKHDFVCRKIDVVSVAGKSQVITLYEVLDFITNVANFPFLAVFEQAVDAYLSGDFQTAIKLFKHHQLLDDNVSKVLVARCELLLSNKKQWNGVWEYDFK
jgi:adenylate cyclase